MIRKSKFAIVLRGNRIVYGVYLAIAAAMRLKRYRDITSYVVFIGYPRSGSSIVGSLLDAHKNIALSHELNILNYHKKGYSRKQLLYLTERNAELSAKNNRISSGYKGKVEGQFNGQVDTLLLLGDKKAGGTTKMLMHSPDLILELQKRLELPVKALHCVRNPFDMITTQAYGGNEKKELLNAEKIQQSIAFFFEKADTVQKIIDQGKNDVYTLRHEQLVANSENELKALFDWLGIECEQEYLSACKDKLYMSPHKSRKTYNWSEEEVAVVEKRLKEYTFFSEYSFKD